MTDTHSHILFNIDDGSNNIEESIAILKEMAKVGFKHVILTPHYIEGTEYSVTNEEKDIRFALLEKRIKEENLDITIHLGNEIFLHNNLIASIEGAKCYGLNKSNYLLVELPFHNQIRGLIDILYEFKVKGYIPIIAHPERYTYLQDNPDLVDKLKEEGTLFQCNYSSILGYYRKDAERLMKYMLKKHYVDYLGTDIHHINKAFVLDNFDKIKKNIIKITGDEYFNEIMENCSNLIKE